VKRARRRKRATIADVAETAGVSVATVDRVLSGRLPVKEHTASLVLKAAESIGFHATPLLKTRLSPDAKRRRFGFLLQKPDEFYRQFAGDLEAATRAAAFGRVRASIEFVPELSPSAIAERMRRLGAASDAIGVVAVDHPIVWEAVADLRAKGVPAFALLSDLSSDARAGYIGRDNRKEGRTAGWIIAHAARAAGEIGVIVGSHRYLCQETAEISFRAYFREFAADFTLLEPLVNLDDSRLAYAAVADLLAKRDNLVGLYICGGGMAGVVAAAREAGLAGRVAIVCNELIPPTRAGLVEGVLTAVISTPTAALSRSALEEMERALAKGFDGPPRNCVSPFELLLPTNV